jgi:hypothetical protein
MRLSQKVATVLAMTQLIASSKSRSVLTEQIDSALALMAENENGLARAVLDSSASEAISYLKHEGWTLAQIAEAVRKQLQKINASPTCKAGMA